MSLYTSIVHIRARPAIDSSPTTPKFSGNWVTANNQTEKTTHITASHISNILFGSLIVHLLSLCLYLIEKVYEPKILILNNDFKKLGIRFSELL
jgi:hypothetical protein